MKALTIIIPCFNCEATVNDTLDSLNLERNKLHLDIIVVNDGSTDSTLNILNEWQSNYPEAIRVIDKKNNNWGSVMNCAKKLVQGKYVRILDSDDKLNKSELRRFISNINQIDADIIFTNFYFYNAKKKKRYKNSLCTWFKYPQKVTYYNLNKLKKNKRSNVSVHATTFSAEIFKKIRDLPHDIFYTDSILLYEVLKMSTKICYIPHLYLYIYTVGQQQQSVNISNFIKNSEQIDIVLNDLINNTNLSKNRCHNTWTSSIIRMIFKLKLLTYSFVFDGSEELKKQDLINDLVLCQKMLSKVAYKTTLDVLLRFVLYTKSYYLFNSVRITYKLLLTPFIKATK